MYPIPPEIIPVLNIIRREVPRPNVLPRPLNTFPVEMLSQSRMTGNLRFPMEHPSCPMGLCKGVNHYTPMGVWTFGHKSEVSNKDVAAFAHWWDSLTDPQEAVDTVWPKE